VFDAAGNRLPSAITIQKPDISGIDNINTSFFGADVPEDDDVLPNFSGTSAATPNVAAIGALIREALPGASAAQIKAALQSTAVPLNGGQAGQWDPQGGFGLIDAFAAIRPFVSGPSVRIAKVSPNPTDTAVGTMKIIFSQQISGFDIADLQFRVQGGPNLLTGANTLRTRDGGRTWFLGNLSNLNAQPGTYTLTLADTGTPITNLAGLRLVSGASASFTKIAPPPPPAAPRDLSAQALDSDTIRLRWTDMSDNETSFTLQRAEDPDFQLNLVNINLPPNTTVYDDELPAGTTFYYRIRAFNDFSGGSTFSRTVLATTLSPGEVIVDNSSGRATVRGDWSVLPKQDFTFGSNFLSDDNSGKGTKSVRFTPNVLEEGDYYVYTRWTRSADRATNVPIDIYYDDDGHRAKKTLTVDQRNRGGAGWVLLGKFHFAAGTNGFVVIRNDGTDGTVIADAVRFLRAENAR
jgi:hypothetical protein